MTSATDDPLNFLNDKSGGSSNTQTELIQNLLHEIIRVKELIIYYENLPNGAGQLGASILTELVTEAYSSLVNYDTELITKYYDLLKHCD
jgi:hypothetical protein